MAETVIEAVFLPRSRALPRSGPPQGVRHEARQRQQQQARERHQQPPGRSRGVRVRQGTGQGAIIARRWHARLLLGVEAWSSIKRSSWGGLLLTRRIPAAPPPRHPSRAPVPLGLAPEHRPGAPQTPASQHRTLAGASWISTPRGLAGALVTAALMTG